jgi:hypothetical protein
VSDVAAQLGRTSAASSVNLRDDVGGALVPAGHPVAPPAWNSLFLFLLQVGLLLLLAFCLGRLAVRLGILTSGAYTIIVLIAVASSLVAPPVLPFAMRRPRCIGR